MWHCGTLSHYVCTCLAGRYCEWAHTTVDRSAEKETFKEYLSTLRLVCDDGEQAYLNWTVAPETPDLVYYQVMIELCAHMPFGATYVCTILCQI
jgi:hypothetical protein